MECSKFLEFVHTKFTKDKWPLDVICGYAKRHKLFSGEMLCTRTLYNYVDLGLLKIKSIDLPLKLRRKTSIKRTIKSKRKLGKSIEERPLEIEERSSFGNWEIDTVVPKKNKEEPALITINRKKNKDGNNTKNCNKKFIIS
ncbi:Transposase and inactivated derivatives, IS30 family [Peptoniphilus indolicus]|uniref:IS30 family transposase n=2 Tax=Peptoniphilus indolicus TaxID=33030 RepID=G4D440_9FIRM|nr:IS30 family transposase [Peptoniphilus indolicus ATCC 29427]SUB75859.1 Transposase and inactivated derivatives, IS30 family [Peptoniphilus indolicus]SUB75981.1 Transposase and inactivated derivatives, IS30 family [Peptoniphilus indolicus]